MRTDAHRPSVIVPEDYTFVAFDYIGGSDLGAIMALKEQREIFRAHMARTGGKYASVEHGGTCFVCGSFACYLTIWYNEKLNEYIQTGEDCAQKMDMSYGDMNSFRRVIGDAREAQAGKKKAEAILGDLGLSAAWALYLADAPEHRTDCELSFMGNRCTCDFKSRDFQYEERTIRDIVVKLVKYGKISDKASAFIKTLLGKIENRPALEAQRAAEAEAAAPCPTGRVIITGRVLTVKVQERPSYYRGDSGTDTKVLIQALIGFKVWGNIFMNVKNGDMVTFTATVTPSEKDTKFGFYSCAAKAAFVVESTGEIVPDYPIYQDAETYTTPELLAAAQQKWCSLYGEAR